jgi:Zn-dependent oligopeptidase
MKFSNPSLTKYIYVICFLILSIFTVQSDAQTVNNVNELVLYLDSKDSSYENICIEYGKETWDLYSMEDESNLKIPKEKLVTFLQDKEFIENIDYWNRNENSIEDEILKRRVFVYNNIIEGTKIELDSEVREKTTYLLDALRNRNDEDSAGNIELEKQVKELMKLRNKKARMLGYENYADYLLDYYGIGHQWFKDFTKSIEEKTGPVYNELLAKIKEDNDSVKYRDVMKYLKRGYNPEYSMDSSILILRETMSGIGINYDSIPIRFVVKEADFGGNCIGVKIPTDFRVIMVPGVNFSAFMHELGHGLHGAFTKSESAILKGYEWCFGNDPPAFYEGMAVTMADFLKHTDWLDKYTNLTDEEIREEVKIDKYSSAVWMRYNLYAILAEIEIYKNEEENHIDVVKKLFKKVFKTDDNMRRPYSLLNTQFIDYPCYLQNYTIADIISYQVHKTLREKFGENYVNNKEVSKFMIDNFYKYGVAKDWKKILIDATGSELDVEEYFRELGLLN